MLWLYGYMCERSRVLSCWTVRQVTTFCDNDENNLETLHNDEAPSVHNDLCDRKSAWEIMREHDDFRGGEFRHSEA